MNMLRHLVGMSCTLNLMYWGVYKREYTMDYIVSLPCAVLCLMMVVVMSQDGTPEQKARRISRSEYVTELLLRKQVQYLNWAILLNKALALHQIQRNRLFKEQISKKPKRRHSDQNVFDFKRSNTTKHWKSWSGSIQIPDLDSPDCRNI